MGVAADVSTGDSEYVTSVCYDVWLVGDDEVCGNGHM